MFKNFFKPNNENVNELPTKKTILSTALKNLIETSPLQIMTHRLFMHHLSDNLKHEPNNPSWQNQALYFWSYDEPFEKKSLPPEFKEYPVSYFIFNELPEELTLKSGDVMPWFGMPCGGTKYFVAYKNEPVHIQQLKEKGVIKQIEVVDLNEKNSSILENRQEYFFLMDQKKLQFINGKFISNEKEIQFSDAYENGLLTIIRPIN